MSAISSTALHPHACHLQLQVESCLYPWERPRSIDDVIALPFNEAGVIKLKLQEIVPHDVHHSSNFVGSVKDLLTGKISDSDAAYGLRPYLKVAADWDEQAAYLCARAAKPTVSTTAASLLTCTTSSTSRRLKSWSGTESATAAGQAVVSKTSWSCRRPRNRA